MPEAEETAARVLLSHVQGDPRAADRLLPLVYDELRGLAAKYMADESHGHTLQPTALVHEAYLRLIQIERIDWKGRAHFLAMAATTLRRVLVDHARAKQAQKRGQGLRVETLDDDAAISATRSAELLSVDVALEKLARVNRRQSQLVELRFFGGLSVEEAALVLGVSIDTAKSDWRFARAWLKRELGAEGTCREP